jgi:hypothetical protein
MSINGLNLAIQLAAERRETPKAKTPNSKKFQKIKAPSSQNVRGALLAFAIFGDSAFGIFSEI